MERELHKYSPRCNTGHTGRKQLIARDWSAPTSRPSVLPVCTDICESHTLVRCLPTPSQEGRSPAGLKTGVAAPTYRPSVLPARAAGGGARASRSGRLPPSAPAAVASALHQLVTDRRTLEVRSSAKAL